MGRQCCIGACGPAVLDAILQDSVQKASPAFRFRLCIEVCPAPFSHSLAPPLRVLDPWKSPWATARAAQCVCSACGAKLAKRGNRQHWQQSPQRLGPPPQAATEEDHRRPPPAANRGQTPERALQGPTRRGCCISVLLSGCLGRWIVCCRGCPCLFPPIRA